MRRWWILALIILLIGAWIFFSMRNRGVIAVTQATVKRGLFIREISGTGSIEAKVFTLTFAGLGRVAQVVAHEGDHVRAGAVLARLDVDKVRAEMKSLQEQLQAKELEKRSITSSAAASEQKQLADLSAAERKLTLTRSLHKTGAVSNEELRVQDELYRNLRSQLAAARSATASQLAGISAARAALLAQQQGLQKSLQESTVIAPVAGKIAKIDYRVGEEAGNGRVQLVQDDTIKITAQISEGESAEIRTGMKATIELDSAPEKRLPAYVSRLGITGTIKGEGGSATLPIELRFVNEDSANIARPNFTITARIIARKEANQILLPLEALMEELENEKKRNFVWLIDKKSMTVSKKYITVSDRNLTQVVVKNLTVGSQVVTLPPDNLKPGARVRKQVVKIGGGKR